MIRIIKDILKTVLIFKLIIINVDPVQALRGGSCHAGALKTVVRSARSRYNGNHEFVDSNYWLTKLNRKATAKGALRLFLFSGS